MYVVVVLVIIYTSTREWQKDLIQVIRTPAYVQCSDMLTLVLAVIATESVLAFSCNADTGKNNLVVLRKRIF
jgi:hypothetical protein